LNIRELTPKDYYLVSLIQNDYPDMSSLVFNFLLLQKLANITEEELDQIPVYFFKPLFKWINDEILEGKVMTVEQWLSLAFHLCKQRWDQSIDWLEKQPVSKILLMLKIQSDFVEKEKQEMKKSARKK
jgi:hypothetical protein